MRILFLGDVVGVSGCSKILNNLLDQIKLNKIDFVIVNGENAADSGVGLTKEICEDFFNCGVNVITTGNHVWDQKEIMNFIDKYKFKEDYDLLIVDFHGEITSEKNAIGHFFDGKATLVVGTHTHIPTNDARILKKGTAYQTDAGMCGDYDSVIGMNKDNSLNRFMKKDAIKHFPAKGDATLSGVIVECNIETGLAKKIDSYIFGGQLKNTY